MTMFDDALCFQLLIRNDGYCSECVAVIFFRVPNQTLTSVVQHSSFFRNEMRSHGEINEVSTCLSTDVTPSNVRTPFIGILRTTTARLRTKKKKFLVFDRCLSDIYSHRCKRQTKARFFPPFTHNTFGIRWSDESVCLFTSSNWNTSS